MWLGNYISYLVQYYIVVPPHKYSASRLIGHEYDAIIYDDVIVFIILFVTNK
jgi:hypothetical protein